MAGDAIPNHFQAQAVGSTIGTDDDAMGVLLPLLLNPRRFEPLCNDSNGKLWLACAKRAIVPQKVLVDAAKSYSKDSSDVIG